MPPRHFVATGFVVRDGKTLLLWHHKLQMWLPPGGHIDEGELPEEALLREIREETGLEAEILSDRTEPVSPDSRLTYMYRPNQVQLEDIGPNHPQHIDLIYFCRAKDGDVRLAPREHGRYRWLSEAELDAPEIGDEVRRTGRAAIRWAASRAEASVRD